MLKTEMRANLLDSPALVLRSRTADGIGGFVLEG
jgi:hypothetical protein